MITKPRTLNDLDFEEYVEYDTLPNEAFEKYQEAVRNLGIKNIRDIQSNVDLRTDEYHKGYVDSLKYFCNIAEEDLKD